MSVSRHAHRVCTPGIATPIAKGIKAQECLQTTARRGAIQGPAVKGRMSHLLPTNASINDTLHFGSTCD